MMNHQPKESALKKEIQRLNKELEYAKLKLLGLETMIQEEEKHLQIRIKKKVWYQIVKRLRQLLPKQAWGSYTDCLELQGKRIMKLTSCTKKITLLIW